jgi:hypothetical protein
VRDALAAATADGTIDDAGVIARLWAFAFGTLESLESSGHRIPAPSSS